MSKTLYIDDYIYERMSGTFGKVAEEIDGLLKNLALPVELKVSLRACKESLQSALNNFNGGEADFTQKKLIEIYAWVRMVDCVNQDIEDRLEDSFLSTISEPGKEVTRLFHILCDFENFLYDICGVCREVRDSLSDSGHECMSLAYSDIFGSIRELDSETFKEEASEYIGKLFKIAELHRTIEKLTGSF